MRPPRPPAPDNRLREPLASQLDAAPAGWRDCVERWRDGPEGRRLERFVAARLSEGADVVPARVLRALRLTQPDAVRVVILGQDPYHGPGQAEGLAFSVPEGQPAPPSLRNIRAEVHRDLGQPMRSAASLAGWAAQGVLLLNATLTVEIGHPGSHAGKGWEALTDDIVKILSETERPIAFLLWGHHAQAKAAVIAANGGARHLVLQCNHPSPLSARRGERPFIGCGHFGQVSRFLAAADPGAPVVDWLG